MLEEFGELDFFDNVEFVWVFELDDIDGGIVELDLCNNIEFFYVFKLDDIAEGIGELDLFDNT